MSTSTPSAARTVSALQSFVDRETLAGAVTLVTNTKGVVSLEAVGYSDVAKRVPMRTDALFWIASMTKPVTATLLMMLADEGKVSEDDAVEKHLPEFKQLWVIAEADDNNVRLKRPSRPITIRDILSHTSGMVFSSSIEQPTIDQAPLQTLIRAYVATSLAAEPGTKYCYSNMGINTAGRIIEVVSGMSFEAFLDERLVKPLGMKDTTFWPNREQLARLAKTYKPGKDQTGLEEMPVTHLRYPLEDRTRGPVPAGGLFSTAQDMGRFCRMILSGGEFEGRRLISADAIARMHRKQTPQGVAEVYGLGWSGDGDAWGHGGAYSTNMMVNLPPGLATVYLVQHAGFPGDGGNSLAAFRKDAQDRFGQTRA